MLKRLDKWIGHIETIWMAGSAMALTLMMLVTVVDVVLRYLFRSPLGWSLGFITDYLLIGLFFLGLSYTFRVNGHISVDAFVRRLPARIQRVLGVIGNVLACLFFALIVYTGAIRAWEAWVNNEVPSGGSTLPWPTWTSYVLVPLGTALLVVRILHSVVAAESIRSSSDETETL